MGIFNLFPDCHNIGVINETAPLLPNEKSYLNCHMYPNGVYGEGIVQWKLLQITHIEILLHGLKLIFV